MKRLTSFVVDAVAVPFEAKGRSVEGWDCWGLVVVAFREVWGLELPSYSESYSPADVKGTEALGQTIRSHMPEWEQIHVHEARAMDVVVFRLKGRPIHVGLCLGGGLVLHTEEKLGTVAERLDSALWKDRIEGVFRHRG